MEKTLNLLKLALLVLLLLLLRKLFWCLRWLWCYYHGKALPEKISFLPQRSGKVFAGHLPQTQVPPAALSAEPDGSVPFGYQASWLAIRCDGPEQAIAALKPRKREPVNWATGLAAACVSESGQVFVSPCLDGFVLVIGDVPLYRLEQDLAPQFAEVQAFFCHRTSSCCLWAKYMAGKQIRSYLYLDGQVAEDIGPLTPEELELGFDRFPHRGQEETSEDLPDEEDVLRIAAAWGVDPKLENKTYPPSAGWLCAL